jgi:DNA polymerase III alpha subunit
MAFLELYDDVTEASFVLFSEAYAKCYRAQLKEDAIVIVTAHKDMRKDGSYLVEDAVRLGD